MPLFHSCERRIGNFQELLTKILAGKKAKKRLRRILKPERHIFLLFEPSFSQPTGKCVNRLRKPSSIVEHDEPFHPRSLNRKVEIIGRTRRWDSIIVARDCAT